MSGDSEAVFLKCKTLETLQAAIDVVFGLESWDVRRLEVGEVAFSGRGWAVLIPATLELLVKRHDGMTRLARLAKTLRAPVYQVSVRGSVATTLFEADPQGRLRISGSPIFFEHGRRATEPTGQDVASKQVSFGLLPVSTDIKERIAQLEESTRLPDYLGTLAGFPEWRRDDIAGELLYYEASGARRSVASDRSRRARR